MISLRTAIEAAVVAMIALAWTFGHPSTQSAPDVHPATPAVPNAPIVTINPKKIDTLAPSVKKKLELPPDDKYVLAASKVDCDNHPHTLVTEFDDTTGKVTTIDKREPLPWFSLRRTGYLRFGTGIRTGAGTIQRVALAEELVQIKAWSFGMDSSIDSDGEGYVGVHVQYGW